MTAAGEWRRRLEAWALPRELLDAVEDSPYSWPPHLWRRRHDEAGSSETETLAVVRRLSPKGGKVIDVGAGTGRASLPLAAEGYTVIGVERNPGMADGFREAAAGLDARMVEGSWPEAAAQAGSADVVMSAHVVYDVQDIAPFVATLSEAAHRGVAVELTPAHPWVHLGPYYKALHDLDRPAGPTVDDFAAVVAESGVSDVHVEHWTRPAGLHFVDRDELIQLFRRRLVLPPSRTDELAALLTPDITEHDGSFMLGEPLRNLCTVWWHT